MKKIALVAAALAATVSALPAAAATIVQLVINTPLSGTFAGVQPFNGNSVLTGSFDFDQITTGTSLNNFSAKFTENGQTTDFGIGGGVTARYNGSQLLIEQGGSTAFSFDIANLSLVNGGPPAFATTTTNATSFQYQGATVSINGGARGSLAAVAAAVPEPTTWGMMILGFGMVGFGLRSRRSANVKANVSFA